jgi:predicted TPR repeat methyltransferase
MHLVGKCQEEIDSRLTNLDGIIDSLVDCESIQTVLDWGGGEGRFVPTSLRSKTVTVLDYSTEELSDPAFLRLDQLSSDQKFDYIQICHVLEHVSEPRSLMLEVASHLNRGGYVYVELPQDRSSEDLQHFVSRPFDMYHGIHEHLNLYSQMALEQLGLSLGLRCVHLGSRQLDFGWINGTIISGLFVKDC